MTRNLLNPACGECDGCGCGFCSDYGVSWYVLLCDWATGTFGHSSGTPATETTTGEFYYYDVDFPSVLNGLLVEFALTLHSSSGTQEIHWDTVDLDIDLSGIIYRRTGGFGPYTPSDIEFTDWKMRLVVFDNCGSREIWVSIFAVVTIAGVQQENRDASGYPLPDLDGTDLKDLDYWRLKLLSHEELYENCELPMETETAPNPPISSDGLFGPPSTSKLYQLIFNSDFNGVAKVSTDDGELAC
jgi:hypothetical protein